MQEVEYKCYTNKGSFKFYASDDHEAMRKALYLSWRDGEDFKHIEYNRCGEHYILRIAVLDLNNKESFTL